MPNLPKDKEQVGIYISKSLHLELKEFVKKQYGGMYGVSLEIEKAIESHLSKYRKNSSYYQYEELKINDNKIWQVKRKVRDELAKCYRIEVDALESTTLKDLKRAIQIVKGSDDRTVDKYIKLLKDYDCIKIINENKIEIS